MWETKKLSKICDIQSGLWKGKKGALTEAYVLRNTNFTSDGGLNYSDVAVLQVETKQLEKRLILPNDIILEKSGGGEKTPVGRVCIHTSKLDKPVSLSNFTARIRVLDENELVPAFLHRFLYLIYISGKTEPMQRNSTGIRNLQITQYKDINVPIPPLKEQRTILAKVENAFSEIDKAINCSEKQVYTVNCLRYNKIRSWMLDLGKEFGYATLSDVSTIQPKKKIAIERLNPDDEVSFLNMNLLGIEQKYSESSINKKLKDVYSAYQYFENNDVVFAKITPCFENGKLSIVRNLKNGTGFGSSEFVILRPKSIIDSEFLYYALLDKSFRRKGKEQMSGAVGHKRVIKDYFYNYKIPAPPIEIQKNIVKVLESIWDYSNNFYLLKCKKREELINLKSCILSHEFLNNSK